MDGIKSTLWGGLAIALLALFLLGAIAIFFARPAGARDLAQWEDADPANRSWFARQMQPDNPLTSCCGESDAYFADSHEVKDGKVYAIITDTRPDGPLGRPHIPPGTRVFVPDHKFKDSRRDPNPDGHGVVFVSSSGNVFCFIAPGGV